MSMLIIVTRHAGAIEWIRRRMERSAQQPVVLRETPDGLCLSCPAWAAPIPILSTATEGDVIGRIVIGNVPLHLASLALQVWAIEFTGNPPRGQEYTAEDMEASGARIRKYRVESVCVSEGED